MAKGSQPSLFKETKDIAALLEKEQKQAIVVLAIPSHDRKNRKLSEAETGEWASNAMELMADLYRGATAFRAEHGIFKTDDGHYLRDHPLMIESYARKEDIEDKRKLNRMVEFCKRMGEKLNQEAIMVVFDDVMYYISDYSEK